MPKIPPSEWYEKAAFEIVRNSYTLFRFSNEQNLGLTSRECENIARTTEFQNALRAQRNRFYKELSDDKSRSRSTAVGQLLFAITKLLDAEQYDKAVNAIAQLFKAEGWTSDAAQINILQDLSGKNIEEIRAKLQQKVKPALAN
jgi:hypothetical protein